MILKLRLLRPSESRYAYTKNRVKKVKSTANVYRFLIFSSFLVWLGNIVFPLLTGYIATSFFSYEIAAQAVQKSFTLLDAVIVVLIGPLVETLILAVLLFTLLRTGLSEVVASVFAATLFAALHILGTPLASLSSFFGFFIFSKCFLYNREKDFFTSSLYSFVPHAMSNGGIFLLLALR